MSAGAPPLRRRPKLPPGYRVVKIHPRGWLHARPALLYDSAKAGPAENPRRREKKRIRRVHGLSGRGWRRVRKALRRLERTGGADA